MASEPSGAMPDLRRATGRGGSRIELTMPADPELFALARLTVSTLAARLDFTIEDIEDLRLAIDELCTICAKGASGVARLQLCLDNDAEMLRVECSVDDVSPSAPPDEEELLPGMTADELSLRILSELVDEYAVAAVDGGLREGYIEKRRAAANHDAGG